MNCPYCEFHCDLSISEGVCKRYVEKCGAVVEREPFRWTAPDFVSMETLPFFHALPGAMALRIGTRSCNAKCDYCINSQLAIEEDAARRLDYIPPAELVARALSEDARAIVFAINEIAVFLPSAIAVAEAARHAGLMVGCLTNGFCSESSASLLAKHMDFVNVSFKSIRGEFYRTNLGLASVQPVLQNIRFLAKHTHVELVTPLASEVTPAVLSEMAAFITSVGSDTPWHLMRLFAAHKREDPQPHDFTSTIEFLTGIRGQLPFTYFGSFPGSNWVDTFCPGCGEKLIRRLSIGACRTQFVSSQMTAPRCRVCATPIPLVH